MLTYAIGVVLLATAVITAPTGSPTSEPDCKKNPNGLVPDPTDVHKFYHCEGGQVRGQAVPCLVDIHTGIQEVFDEKQQTCVPSQGDLDTACKKSPNGLIPDPSDPHKFFHCDNGHINGGAISCQTDSHTGQPMFFDYDQQTCVTSNVLEDDECKDIKHGLIPDPSDPHKFLHCQDGHVQGQAITCQTDSHTGEVMIFDRDQQTCVPKKDTDDNACQKTPNGLIPDPSDPHRFFHCDNGHVNGHAIDCAVDTHTGKKMVFDKDQQTCVPEKDNSNDKSCQKTPNGLIPDPSDPHKFFKCNNGHVEGNALECPVDGHTGQKMVFDNTQQSCVPDKSTNDVDCSKNPNGLIPDPSDVHKFFHCDNGKVNGHAIDCAVDTHTGKKMVFDKDQQTCVPEKDNTNDKSCQKTPNGLIADPSDPHKFFKCNNGHVEGNALDCPLDGHTGKKMVFDNQEQTCVPEKDNSNDKSCQKTPNGLIPDPSDPHKFFKCDNGHVDGKALECPVDTHTGQKMVFDNSQQTCVPDKSSHDGDCSKNPNGLIPDPSDVHRFFHCDNGKVNGHAIDCAVDTHTGKKMVFDKDQQTCVPEKDNSNDKSCQKTPDGLIPDPSDAHKFFKCNNGHVEGNALECPVDSHTGKKMVFDNAEQTCVPDKGTDNSACKQTPNGLIPDTSDPHKFFKCDNGHVEGNALDCPLDGHTGKKMVFDNKEQTCVPEKDNSNDNSCQKTPDALIADPSDPHKFFKCNNGHVEGKALDCPVDTHTGEKMVFDVKEQTCVPGKGKIDAECKDDPNGLIPDPSDPHKFYHCDNGHVQGNAISCQVDSHTGKQMIFDKKAQTCVLAP